MPIVDFDFEIPGVLADTPRGLAVTPGALGADEPVEPERPGFLDALNAHFSYDNLIASIAGSEAWRAPTERDPNFDAWQAISGSDLEPYWERYTDVHNQAQFDAVTHDIRREEEARKIMDATPAWQSFPMTFAAGVLDPTILIPGGAFVRGAKGGLSVARSALNVGLATGTAVGVQEAGLQATQQLRTAAESGTAIGASVLLGGILGAGGARLLNRAEWREAVEAIDRELSFSPRRGAPVVSGRIDTTKLDLPPVPDGHVRFFHSGDDYEGGPRWLGADPSYVNYRSGAKAFYVDVKKSEVPSSGYDEINGIYRNFEAPESIAQNLQMIHGLEEPPPLASNEPFPMPVGAAVGAQVAPQADIDALTIAGRAAGGVAKPTAFLNPGLRLMRSPSLVSRETAANTFEMTQYLKGADADQAAPLAVETLRKEWNAGLMKAADYTRSAFSEYRKRAGRDGLSRRDFAEAVGKAMRRNDEHEIPEVANAAKSWRASVFDPLKDAAIEAKLLPEDVSVDEAASYFSRMYNRPRLIGEEHLFKRTVTEWLESQAPRWISDFEANAAARLAKANEDEIAKVRAEIEAEREMRFEDIPGRAREIANEVYDKLTGRMGDSVRPYAVTVGARGPLKGRTFHIPDELIERWLESDIDMVGRRYQRIMSADIEMTRKFGSVDMAEQIKAIREDYQKLRAQTSDEKELARLTKAENADVRDIQGIRDLIRGTYDLNGWENNYGRIARMANMLNYIRSMGQVSLSSLPEAYRTAMVHGLRPFMQTLSTAIRHPTAFKMGVREAKLAGNITERALSNRLATLAEIGDFYTSRGPVEKFMANMVETASTWNGIRIWTDGAKMIAGVATQNRILDVASSWASTSQKNKRYLRFLGLSEPMAQRIAKQFDEFGETIDGVRVANTEDWSDQQAVRAYRAAVNKDIDTQVVTRSVADIPLFANTPLGRLLFQFNTFNLASHQRVLLRGLQEGPSRFIQSAIAMTSMGMLVTWLQAKAANRDVPDPSENPGWWVGEGLDKSGLIAIPMQLANAAEKAIGVNVIRGPLRAFDREPQQSLRLYNRTIASTLGGPTLGMIEDARRVAGIPTRLASGDEITRGEYKAAERLFPYNSYLGLRQMFRYVLGESDDGRGYWAE